jgi:hypothetical protein
VREQVRRSIARLEEQAEPRGVDIDKDKLFELGLQLGASPASRGDAQSNAYGRLARHAPNDYFAISA